MKLVAYRRVSTTGQGDSGLGLDAQERAIAGYAGLYGHEILRWETDVASGTTMNGRPGLARALAAVRCGEADGIIVSKLCRLARSVRDLGAMLEDVFKRRGALISVAEQVDTGSAMGRLVLTIMSAITEMEAARIGENTSAALQARKRSGRATNGRAPYGWVARGGAEGGLLVMEETEQAALRWVKEAREGGAGWHGIARTMNEAGWRTRTGRAWDPAGLRRATLRNTETLGIMGLSGDSGPEQAGRGGADGAEEFHYNTFPKAAPL